MVMLVLILAVPILLFEGIPLFREERWGELLTLGFLLGLALWLPIGKMLGVPTPIELLGHWLRPVGQMYLKSL